MKQQSFRCKIEMTITTTGGVDMARRIFSNILLSDPNRPLLKIEVERII